MSNVANASINTFGPSPKADFVPPSEQLITLTYAQLQDLVTQAVEKAIQPLQAEVSDLKATVASQDEKITTLEATAIEQFQIIDGRIKACGRLMDRQDEKIESILEKKPGKTELARVDKIERYLISRPDHRATFETLKGFLQVDNVRLSETIKILMASTPGRYSIQKARTGDKRKKILVLLPR